MCSPVWAFAVQGQQGIARALRELLVTGPHRPVNEGFQYNVQSSAFCCSLGPGGARGGSDLAVPEKCPVQCGKGESREGGIGKDSLRA